MNDFHKWRWRFLALWLVLFTAINVVTLEIISSDLKDGKDSRDAICALVRDYHERTQGTIQFLKDNPNGIPGVTEKSLRITIKNQKRTALVLDKSVRC